MSGHHRKAVCNASVPCPFHNPSKHLMRRWPKIIRASALIERRCPHGVGHPDPDSVAWMDVHSYPGSRGTWGVHGCDGCCTGQKFATETPG